MKRIFFFCIAFGLLLPNVLEAQLPKKFRPSPWGVPLEYGACLSGCVFDEMRCSNDAHFEYFRASAECYRAYWDLKQCCDEFRDCCDYWDNPYDVYWYCMEGYDNQLDQALFNCTIFYYACLLDCEELTYWPFP